MVKPLTILRRLLKVFCYISGGFGIVILVIILAVVLKKFEKDKVFVQTNLIPLAEHVESFRVSIGRLPTEEEFNNWAETNFESKAVWYYTNKPDFMKDWGLQGKDFVVGTWRGEWVEYYRSWDKKAFTQ